MLTASLLEICHIRVKLFFHPPSNALKVIMGLLHFIGYSGLIGVPKNTDTDLTSVVAAKVWCVENLHSFRKQPVR